MTITYLRQIEIAYSRELLWGTVQSAGNAEAKEIIYRIDIISKLNNYLNNILLCAILAKKSHLKKGRIQALFGPSNRVCTWMLSC